MDIMNMLSIYTNWVDSGFSLVLQFGVSSDKIEYNFRRDSVCFKKKKKKKGWPAYSFEASLILHSPLEIPLGSFSSRKMHSFIMSMFESLCKFLRNECFYVPVPARLFLCYPGLSCLYCEFYFFTLRKLWREILICC